MCQNKERTNTFLNFDVILANARSIEAKIDSIYQYFEEYGVASVFVCETWMKSGGNYNRIEEELAMNKNLSLIAYNRPGKKVGGGVGIIFDPTKLRLQENVFTRRGYEIVSAKGKIVGLNRNIVLHCVYLPPSMTRKKANDALSIISENMLKM